MDYAAYQMAHKVPYLLLLKFYCSIKATDDLSISNLGPPVHKLNKLTKLPQLQQ